MTIAAQLARGTTDRIHHAGAEQSAQHASDVVVELLDIHLRVADRTHEHLAVVARRARHLQVEARIHCLDRGVNGAPVRHHHAVEAPLVLQHLGEQPAVLGHERAVEPVVGAHHRPRLRLAHDHLERREIDLTQRALVDVRAADAPLPLLLVRDEVLDARADAFALQAAHERRADDAAQLRIFRIRFEVAAGERIALDVDVRAEQHVHAERACFAAHRSGGACNQLRIPRRCHRHAGGERSRRVAARRAHAVRSVGEAHCRDAEARHRDRREIVRAGDQRRLLFHRQAHQQIGDAMLERSGGILVERKRARCRGFRCELVLDDARLHGCACLVAQAIGRTGARSCSKLRAIGTTQRR